MYWFSQSIRYNLDNLECFLFDVLDEWFLEHSIDVDFTSCDIDVHHHGGVQNSSSSFCAEGPCIVDLSTIGSGTASSRRLLEYSINSTVNITTTDLATQSQIDNIGTDDLAADLEEAYSAEFDLEMEVDTISVEWAAAVVTAAEPSSGSGHWTDVLFEGINLYLSMAAVLVLLSCVCGCCLIWWMHRHREQQKRVAYQFAFAVETQSKLRLQGMTPKSTDSQSPKFSPPHHSPVGSSSRNNSDRGRMNEIQAKLAIISGKLNAEHGDTTNGPPHGKGMIVLQDSNEHIEMVPVDSTHSNRTVPTEERRRVLMADSNSPRSDLSLNTNRQDFGAKSVDVDRITTPQLNQFEFVASFSEQSATTLGSNKVSPFQQPQPAPHQLNPFEIAMSAFNETVNGTQAMHQKQCSVVERAENEEEDEKASEIEMEDETPMGPEPDSESEEMVVPNVESLQNGNNVAAVSEQNEIEKSPKIEITTPNATQNVEWQQQLGYSRGNMVNVPSHSAHSAQMAVAAPLPALKDNASNNSLSVEERANVMSEEIRSRPLPALTDDDDSENRADVDESANNPNRLSVNRDFAAERSRRNREHSRSAESSTDGMFKNYSRESSMILTDIESSGDDEQRLPATKRLAVPRQTTMEFHHHLMDDVNCNDTLMEDVVSDMAGTEFQD